MSPINITCIAIEVLIVGIDVPPKTGFQITEKSSEKIGKLME